MVRYVDEDGEPVRISSYVAELPNGRWVVAQWTTQWTTQNISRASERAGYSGAFARKLEALDTPSYKSRAYAVRVAARVYGLEVAA